MAINWILLERIAQGTLSLIVLGCMAYVSSWWTSHWHASSPPEFSFLLFTSAWSLLALTTILFTPRFKPSLSPSSASKAVQMAFVALEALTTLYWLAGFIAMAVFLSGRICFGAVCQVAKFSVGFSALAGVSWGVTTVFGVWGLVRRRGAGMDGGMGKGDDGKVVIHQGV